MKKRIVFSKLAFFMIMLFGLAALGQVTGANKFIAEGHFQHWVESLGFWGPAIYILIYTISPSLFIPGAPITLAAGLAFGPFWGTIYALTGATMGASLAFIISRYFARKQVETLLEGRMKALDEGIEKRGWVFVAVTRLIPLFPFNMLNYAFGLTKISFKSYVTASFIFMAPGTAAYAALSGSLSDIIKGDITASLILGIGIFTALYLAAKKYKMKD